MKKLEFRLTKYRLIMMAIIGITAISIYIFKVKAGYINYIAVVVMITVAILTYFDNKKENK